MSVVCGLEVPGGVWLAADSYISSMMEGSTTAGKLVDLNGFAIGVVGTLRHAQVIRHGLEIEAPSPGVDVEYWAVKGLLPALRELGEEESLDLGDDSFDLMVAVNGAVMVLQSDWTVIRYLEGYAATGAGSAVSLGAFHATRRWKAERRVTEATAAACHHVPCVGGPVETLWVPYES